MAKTQKRLKAGSQCTMRNRRSFIKYAGMASLWTVGANFLPELAFTSNQTFRIDSDYGSANFKRYALNDGNGLEILFASRKGQLSIRSELRQRSLMVKFQGQDNNFVDLEIESQVPFDNIFIPKTRLHEINLTELQDPVQLVNFRQKFVDAISEEDLRKLNYNIQINKKHWKISGGMVLNSKTSKKDKALINSVTTTFDHLENSRLLQSIKSFDEFINDNNIRHEIDIRTSKLETNKTIVFAATGSCILGIASLFFIPFFIATLSTGFGVFLFLASSSIGLFGVGLGCAGK